MTGRRSARRAVAAGLTALLLVAGCSSAGSRATPTTTVARSPSSSPATAPAPRPAGDALAVLDSLAVKGRAPKTGYSREEFGPAWADVDRNGCDTRNDILNRDLVAKQWRPGTHGCVVVAGTVVDPYTGRTLQFAKADAIAVQIDHVVALSDAWQTGAQALSATDRLRFANDPVNLFAVDGPTNEAKGDADAASWLPPNRRFRCTYVEHQIAAKARYGLWVTPAERDAMRRVLSACPGARIPDGPP